MSMGAAAVGAAPGKGKGAEKAQTKVEQKAQTTVEADADAEAEATVTTVIYDEDDTVTGDVYAKGNTQGLLNAWKNVQGNKAAEKIQAILESRGVTAEELAAALEAGGEVEAAVVAQEEAVAQTPTDAKLVKQLAKLMKKVGHTGILAFVNGEQPEFDVKPFVKEGRTLVPFRAIGVSLNAEVSYDAATKTVTVVRGDVTVKLTLGSDTAYVDGEPVKLDVTAQSVEGRTVIPLRFLSEAFGATVEFDDETQSVIITEKVEAEAAAE